MTQIKNFLNGGIIGVSKPAENYRSSIPIKHDNSILWKKIKKPRAPVKSEMLTWLFVWALQINTYLKALLPYPAISEIRQLKMLTSSSALDKSYEII